MGPGGSKLADLAAELLRRGASTDQVFEVIQAAERGDHSSGPEERSPPRQRSTRTRHAVYITHDQVLAAMAALGRAVTAEQIVEWLPPGAPLRSVVRHLTQGVKLGNMMRIGRGDPGFYSLTKAGEAVARDATIAPVRKTMASVGAPTASYVISQERFREVLGTIKGSATVAWIRDQLGNVVTDQAIRMRLAKEVRIGTVVQNKTSPYTYSLPGRSGGKVKNSPKGENNAKIVAALKAAGKPLNLAGFKQSTEMRHMTPVAISQALWVANRDGYVKRASPGFYVPATGKPAPVKRTPRAKKAVAVQEEPPERPEPVAAASLPN